MRVLVADDMPKILDRQAQLLEAAGCTVVHRAPDGQDAAEWLEAHLHAVDAVFLDVEMPGLNGLEVAQRFPHLPSVIVTAHQTYAVDAWEAATVDYLLKPFSAHKLRDCLDRLERRLLRSSARKRILLQNGSRPVEVMASEVEAFDVDEHMVWAHLRGAALEVVGASSLAEIEAELPVLFRRVGRDRLERIPIE